MKVWRERIGLEDTQIGKIIDKASFKIQKTSKIILGLTSHPVFMDSHFEDYNHVIAIEAQLQDNTTRWLPIIDREGMPGPYIYSFNWVKWTFRVNSPKIDQENLIRGIRDFTLFWAHQNGLDINNIRFNIKVKKIRIPKKWEKDFLQKQLDNSWISGGYVTWKNNEFQANLKDIEEL